MHARCNRGGGSENLRNMYLWTAPKLQVNSRSFFNMMIFRQTIMMEKDVEKYLICDGSCNLSNINNPLNQSLSHSFMRLKECR